MTQHPDDIIAWCGRHEGKSLGICGVSKRKLAASKMKGLLRANGISPLGFVIDRTITLPTRRDVVNHVARTLFTKVEQRHPVFLDNRDTLMGEAIGVLVIYDMDLSQVDRLMSAVRSDMDKFLAATSR